jgi:hypothetical protein
MGKGVAVVIGVGSVTAGALSSEFECKAIFEAFWKALTGGRVAA